MKNNLIIKSSFSKLTNGEIKSNWGDMIRSGILAECMDGDYFWLTQARSVPLLKWIIDEKKIISFEEFEKLPPDLNIYNADNYVADQHVFEQLDGVWHGYKYEGNDVIPQNKQIQNTEAYVEHDSDDTWQQSLVEGMGFTWKEQDYPTPAIKSPEIYDVGLNWHVHAEWTAKWWPKKNWEGLYEILTKEGFIVSWQQGLTDFDEYMGWMNSCRVIISVETLGLHLASALKKKIIAMIGPASNSEFTYGRMEHVKPPSRECMPCNIPVCDQETHCMDDITVEVMASRIREALRGK